jgi:BirA family biotin operon repressor/biotin-[acetyl-CoA-carboxylase] ligase
VRDPDRLQEFLELLKEPASGYASGQWLAKKAGISRSAVWKQVQNLRRYGYVIESLHGRGYRLAAETEYPVPWELGKLLKTSIIGRGVIVYRFSTDSTQSIALSLAGKENSDGAVVIAEQQSSGRGRMKRKWVSPRGGIWLSVVVKPSIPTAASTMLPFAAAVAVADAIKSITGLDAALKWPNDVMIGGKKVAGILLDLSAEAETVNYAVIGIGINVNVETSKIKIDRGEGRPPITSLKEETGRDVNRLRLTAALLEKLEHYCRVLEQDPLSIIAKWRTSSGMIGKNVTVMLSQQGKKEIKGVAADINDDGSLLIRTKEHGDINVISGDVIILNSC